MQVEKSWVLPFPLSKVYAAWVSSDTVIPPATKMDVLPEVGGHYRLFMQMPDFAMTNEGTFSLVEPEKRLVYTWEWNQDGEVSTIDVTFSEAENGTSNGTSVSLVHSGFLKEESVAQHDSGWDSYIEGFTALLQKS